jgi:outer membrane protein assembly factor BamB
MSGRLFVAVVLLGLTGSSVRGQTPGFFSRATIPTRTALARVGLERHWSGIVPLGHGNERVLLISVAGNMVFAQTNMANFHAFDGESGRYLWGVTLGRPTASARPVSVNSDRVFVTNSKTLTALDRGTGRLIWEKQLEALPTSATAADEELVTVGLKTGKLVAYNIRDHSKDRPPGPRAGTFAWAWKTDGPLTSRPIPTERVVAFASQDKRVYVAIHETPPRLLYRYLTAGSISADMGTYGTRTLIVPSEDNNLYAIDLFLAETRWVFSSGAPILQPPLVAGTDVFVLNRNGRLTALDINTGEPRWDLTTGEGQLQALSRHRIYLRFREGDMMIVERGSGQVLADARTTIERGGLNLREYTIAPSNPIDDRLYFATTSGSLLCLREIGQVKPYLLRDPKATKFGFVPKEGEPPPSDIPQAIAPAETPTATPAETKPAGEAKPKDEAKPGDEEKPKDEQKPADDEKPKDEEKPK